MRLCLRILNAPEGEKLLTLDPPGGLVGRSADNALVLGYDSVSRLHAELRHDGKDWWLHHRSQTSATLLDEQLLVASTPRRLGPRGSMQLGRVVVEYHQQALPATPQPPAEPSPSEVTLVLPRRTSVIFPQALLSQMSPVRVDAAPEPAGPPPTLTRLPRLTPPVPPAPTEPHPSPPRLRPSRPPPPAAMDSPPTLIRPNRAPPPELDSPPTLIRSNQPPPPAAMDSPPTLIRPNQPPPPAAMDSPPTLIRPNQPPPPAAMDSPPTLIRSNRPPIPAAAESGPPPTLIRRNQPPPVPPSSSAGPAPRVRPAPSPTAQSGPMAAAQRLENATAPLVEHQHDLHPALAPAAPALLAQLQAERDRLRSELEQATAEAARLRRSEAALKEAHAALGAVQPTSPEIAELREKALELLQPFSRSLEQVGEALRKGTPEEARALLRSASFALADLRDLFQS